MFCFLFHVFADTLSIAKKPILIERKFSKWEDGQKCLIVFNSAELRCPSVAVEQTDPPIRVFIFVFVIVCLKKYAKGQELFMKVCDHLNLLEKDYYGVAIWETATLKVSDCLITFCVTFISFVNLAGTTYSWICTIQMLSMNW